MNFKFLYISIFVITFFSSSLFAQEKKVKGYRIEGNEIVFTFDKRDYAKITDERNQRRIDFDDFDIKNVVVSGEFNLWSRNAWKMEKVDENIYQLRKKIADFKDNFEWQFKFVVNNNFWAEPSNDITNIIRAKEKGNFLDTYNLRFIQAYPNKDGNASFYLKGYKNAKKVILSGSFNKWDEQLFEMNKTEDGWKLTLQLRPKVHQYKFIVDGQWITDPNNANKIENEYDGYNSLLEIKTEVEFHLSGYDDAKEVILAGDFNDWSEKDCKMVRTKNGWTRSLHLTGGKYHYKYIIDGKWVLDPHNSVREYDGKGHINSVKMVR